MVAMTYIYVAIVFKGLLLRNACAVGVTRGMKRQSKHHFYIVE